MVPTIVIEATVDPSLKWITGTMTVTDGEGLVLVDPLASLPMPTDDTTLMRTYPGAPERGVVRWDKVDDHTYTFYTLLPRRLEDVGVTRRGLFANGSWYPQPLDHGHLPVVAWDVEVHVPSGTKAALGDVVGDSSTLHWRGAGERASLAVIPHGQTARVDEAGVDLVVLSRHRPRKRLLRELATDVPAARPETEVWNGVVVEAPLRRRLARPGIGVCYVSDRAFRVTKGLQRFHRVAVTDGVVESLLYEVPDPYERDVAAASIVRRWQRSLAGKDARHLLGFGAWIPGINALLYDKTLPFWGDILEEVVSADELQDDLVERYDPHAPGPYVVAQVTDGWGAPAADAIGAALLSGHDLDGAAQLSGVPAPFLEAWRRALPLEDYTLKVEGDPPTLTVTRQTVDDAPSEVVVIREDDRDRVWTAPPGPGTWKDEPIALKHARIDVQRHTAQTSTLGDAWPRRWSPTASAWVSAINVKDGYAVANAYATLREMDDTHNQWYGELYTDQEDLLGANLEYIRQEGPLLNGLLRPHRFTVSLGPALLDPRYGEGDGKFLVGGGLSYDYDDRVDPFFPLEGHAVHVSTDAGVIPGTSQQWWSLVGSTTGIVSPQPRWAFAGEAGAGLSIGNVEHRLLSLGGKTALTSIPVGEVLGQERVFGKGEIRWAPIRDVNVPVLGLTWITEVQLTGGAEIGAVWRNGQLNEAYGVTAGLGVKNLQLGVDEAVIGVTAGWPLWTHNFQVDHPGWPIEKGHIPELTVRWAQAF